MACELVVTGAKIFLTRMYLSHEYDIPLLPPAPRHFLPCADSRVVLFFLDRITPYDSPTDPVLAQSTPFAWLYGQWILDHRTHLGVSEAE